MFLMGSGRTLVISPSDLRRAATCEFAVARELDITLGRVDRGVVEDDPMGRRIIELGSEHEQAELRRLRARHTGSAAIRQFPLPAHDRVSLEQAAAATRAALIDPTVEVIYQGTFFDGGFVGHADFLERTEQGWLVSDTKLARSASVPALLQIAAYAAQLRADGIPAAPVARLVLGSGVEVDYPLDDILPVYVARRNRLDDLLADHRADGEPAHWGDPRWIACGRCEVCEPEVEAARDLLLVAGMRGPTRRRFLDAGITSIEALAQAHDPVADVRSRTQARLREQARLQLAGEASEAVLSEVTDLAALGQLPPPSPGDVFFDFEGDPLWTEPGSSTWGLEYLFGVVTVDEDAPSFRAFWAHDRAAERAALIDFISWLNARRHRWPDLRVYHYAPYETASLLRLAARHGVCEDEVDQLLREGVFVDLYAVVRGAIRVSQRSYSLKKLEPLYMPAREAAVTNAADSIVVYHQFIAATDAEQFTRADELLAEIAAYNEDDCVSTLRLRDWLLTQRDAASAVAAEDGAALHADALTALTDGAQTEAAAPVTPQRQALIDLETALRRRVDGIKEGDRTPEEQALALVAASVLFHAREDKPIWQAHFERLRTPVGDWRGEDGVFLIEDAEVAADWFQLTSRQRPRRRLVLDGEPMRGIPLSPGAAVSAVYASPAPAGMPLLPGHTNAKNPATVTILDAEDYPGENNRLRQRLTIEELAPKDGGEHPAYPVALVPSKVIPTTSIDGALSEIAQRVLDGGDELPTSAGIDVLLRRPPRLSDGLALPAVGEGPTRHIDAIQSALTGMHDSYVAVQGPPGTGKTWVGAAVIARLVRDHGWRVGVTSQGHKAIENLLGAIVDAGVPAAQVGKETRASEDPTWTSLEKADDLAGFAAEHASAGTGYVIGGTAWDLTKVGRVARGQLDLVVVDEAGQYSLAKTLAVSVAGARLLLLGDPAQLAQVSTGTHGEPVDESALGWLIGAAPILPADLGYFLESTWRMHPALCSPVSHLSYAGALTSHETVTTARRLDGVEPGLHVRLVDHHDNSQTSPEEAAAVVDLARDLLGRSWEDPQEKDAGGRPVGPRPLREDDLIVVTPYNQQVRAVRRALDEAGLTGIPVGSVDKFQGQQAAVAILTMAASSPSDVSRGMGFLLDRHRLNVAISRGKFAAYLIRSEVLTEFGPRSPGELVALGAFLGLGERAATTTAVPVSAPRH